MKTIVTLVFTMSMISATAGNWPQWRGPNHNGVSSDTGLATSWSKDENIRWRLALDGPGPSTPVIWGDRIFLTGAEGSGKEAPLIVMAVNTKGDTLWKQTVGDGNYDARQGESNGAAPSPATDGEHLWTFFGNGLLICWDLDGNEIWRRNLQQDTAEFSMYFGMSTTPLLEDGKLYVQLLHANDQSILAIDAKTGKDVWRIKRASDAKQESLHSYASPIPFNHKNKRQLIIHGSDYISGHNFKDGSEVWRSGGLQKPEYNPFYRFVTSPVVTEDGLIIAPSAKNGPVLAIKAAGAEGDITAKDEFYAWKRPENTPDVPSPTSHDGLLYLCRENGVLICMDLATGKELYQERTHSFRHRSSPVYADGKIYVLAADGTTTVVKAGKEFEILATNKLDERVAASMAVADGVIYLRTYDALYAIAD